MILLVPLALAGSSATSFATDAGDWSGGTLGDGLLTLVDESATLDAGTVQTFDFSARLRVASGERLEVTVGGCSFVADYTGDQALSFGGNDQPFGVDELAFSGDSAPVLSGADTTEAAGVGDPDLVSFGGAWWMLYTATDITGLTAVHAATSADLTSWTPVDGFVIEGGAQPTAVVVDGTLVVYYTAGGSLYRTSTPDGVDFSFPTVALAPGPDFDKAGLGHPSVTVDGDRTWHLWYGVPTTGATGLATSADGVTFTRAGELTTDASRLAGLDVVDDVFGLEGVYTMLDSVGFATGDNDASFTDSASDLRPLLSMAETSWSEGGFGTATVLRDGTALHLFVDAVDDGGRVIGHVPATPVPGNWASFALSWDGALLSATWNDGPTLTCADASGGPIVVTATGTVELDESRLDYAADTADTADTATPDTANDSADTAGGTDSGLDEEGLDSADTGLFGFNAGEWLGEPGGCGCQSAEAPRAHSAASFLGLLLLFRAALLRPSRSA